MSSRGKTRGRGRGQDGKEDVIDEFKKKKASRMPPSSHPNVGGLCLINVGPSLTKMNWSIQQQLIDLFCR
jgi:hypothetical protein